MVKVEPKAWVLFGSLVKRDFIWVLGVNVGELEHGRSREVEWLTSGNQILCNKETSKEYQEIDITLSLSIGFSKSVTIK